MTRYIPTMTPDHKSWVILDLELKGYCTIPHPDDPSSLIPLEWKSRESANGWLRQCYQQWQAWEMRGGGQPPTNWRPLALRRVSK